ncbi:MAG: helix-turn-helix transcriptional regulator [Bacteroidia bacterium]|nr:helix-turn-helix transcriptional regulator [Bacteroidia bacterium]
MQFTNQIPDFFYRRQKWFLPVAIFLALCAIAFRFDGAKTQWAWDNYPFIAILLTLLAILAVWIWVKMETQKLADLTEELKVKLIGKEGELSQKMAQLSEKQKEVFDLIAAGKSNKEIMDILSIEQSTLKTHINQLYKKLGITSRREARMLRKTEDFFF